MVAALYRTMSTNTSDAGLDAAIDAMMRPVADAAASFIFFSVELFGTQVPLIVLWLIGGTAYMTIGGLFAENQAGVAA